MMKKINKKMLAISLLIIAISILSITNGSMWFDEICRVVDAIEGSLSNTIKTGLSFAQPGYLLYMYLWERITLGNSIEFIIRCSNLVFVPIAIYYAYQIVKAKKWNIWTILLFFIHPMFVYYMNEATPYIIVYSLSLAYTYYVFFSKDFNSKENILKINIIYLLGVFIHFIFGFIIIPYIVKCLFENYKNKAIIKSHIIILLLFSIIYAPLLIVYMLNLVHVTTGFGIKNIAYIIYSFIGMAGVGLSRNDLRALNFNKISNIQIILLIIMLLTCICISYLIIKNIKKIIKAEKIYLICIIIYFAIIFIIGAAIQFGAYERHCYTIFPLFLITLIDITHIILNDKNKVLFVLYIILLIYSSLNIRFNYYYRCDDYKGVYNYIKSNKENIDYLIVNYNTDIYDISYVYDKKHILKARKDNKLMKEFEKRKDATLILFEKNSSEYIFSFYDNKASYKIDDQFNSFKIIKHNKQ